MSKVIESIANSFDRLSVNCPDRNKAFGIVYNNTEVGGIQLSQHAAGKRVANAVLDQLGYAPLERTKATVKGNLDEL